jgi:hypothetical protein
MLKCADQRPEPQPSRAPCNCREQDVGQGSDARHAKVPGHETAPNSDPGSEVHVVSVSISVYGHGARDSLGAGDYKAHVQVS